jgi:hypothetical protein
MGGDPVMRGHHQVPFVQDAPAEGLGADQLRAVEVGGLEQTAQGQQRPGLTGLLLAVDLLKAGHVGSQPRDLRPHQRDALV